MKLGFARSDLVDATLQSTLSSNQVLGVCSGICTAPRSLAVEALCFLKLSRFQEAEVRPVGDVRGKSRAFLRSKSADSRKESASVALAADASNSKAARLSAFGQNRGGFPAQPSFANPRCTGEACRA